MTQNPVNLPAIASSLAGIPAALVPASVKALDRLMGAATDIPVAWLVQQKAKIDAQTQAYALVEAEISRNAALEAGSDPEIIGRAVNILVRKAYRKQENRDAVAAATIEELKADQQEIPSNEEERTTSSSEIDDDWLNVFERYVEDATSERMQRLWGRVLSGEIRHPGRFSMRTLRFLSEFSQKDAVAFEAFASNTFSGIAPKSLVKEEGKDITELLDLESAGLITGASGLGLTQTITVQPNGFAFLVEDSAVIAFKGIVGAKIVIESVFLTPLGVELVTLLPGRNPRSAARSVAFAIRSEATKEAYLSQARGNRLVGPRETLWLSPPSAPDEASP